MRLKSLLLIIISVLCYSALKAQTNKVSVDINLPYQVGESTGGASSTGYVDFGVKVNSLHSGKFHFGFSSNMGYFSTSYEGFNYLSLKARLSSELVLGKFIPYIGLGYALLNFRSNRYNYYVPYTQYSTIYGGNVNIGLKFIISQKLYLNLGYDYISIADKFQYTSTDLNQDGEMKYFEFGLGIQW